MLLVIVALGNLVAAFADDLSIRSFFASMTDLGLAAGAAFVFVLQAGALELESRALSMGLNLFAVVIEIALVAANLGFSLLGAAADDALEQKGR